jgi:hypothetical protein
MRGLFRSYDARAKENLTASRSALFDYFLTISTGKCASSEGWHEQWVKVPPG